jgi:hypothetical protein
MPTVPSAAAPATFASAPGAAASPNPSEAEEIRASLIEDATPSLPPPPPSAVQKKLLENAATQPALPSPAARARGPQLSLLEDQALIESWAARAPRPSAIAASEVDWYEAQPEQQRQPACPVRQARARRAVTWVMSAMGVLLVVSGIAAALRYEARSDEPTAVAPSTLMQASSQGAVEAAAGRTVEATPAPASEAPAPAVSPRKAEPRAVARPFTRAASSPREALHSAAKRRTSSDDKASRTSKRAGRDSRSSRF